MKANELMIGDLVRIKDLKDPIKRISCIDEYLGVVDFWDGEKCIVTSINNVLPIPLTMEILVRNKFRNNDIEYIYQNIANDGCVHVMLLDTGCGTWDITIKDYNKFEDNQTVLFKANGVFLHLHELQHYLRLCGIEKEIEL